MHCVSGNIFSSDPQTDDYFVLVQSCFSSLWNACKGRKYVDARDKFHCQMRALSFLLLLGADGASSIICKAPLYADDAVREYEASCEAVSEDDAAFLVDEMQMIVNGGLTGYEIREKNDVSSLRLFVLSEMLLTFLKLLCKVGLHHRGTTLAIDFERRAKEYGDFQSTALSLGKRAVKIHSAFRNGGDTCQALTECARALRSLQGDLEDQEARSILEGCRLVVWVVESGHSNKLSGSMLLSWFSFLEEHQELLLKTLNKASAATEYPEVSCFPTGLRVDFAFLSFQNSLPQTEASNLQQALCYNVYLGFVFAHESMVASQVRLIS